MKKNSILGTVILSSLLVAGTGVVSHAATYSSATNAQSNGKVTFIEGDPEIVDPGNPDKPVIPVNPEDPDNPENPPVNLNKGDLMIQYVSDFDFGVHKKTVKGMTANAKADKVFDVIENNKFSSESREVIPFVSTLDTRTDREGGWKLRVSATEFKGTTKGEAKTVILKGAEIIFSNASYANPKAVTPKITSNAAEQTIENALRLTNSPQVIATSDESSVPGQGMGSYSLSLGSKLIKQTDDNTESENTYNVSDGVTFSLPANTSVSVTDYQANINWELVPGI